MEIRTAILGYGRSGSTMHAGPIEKNDAFDMVAVCDIDRARQEQARARFNCPIYDDYHEMLAKESLDLVCVITRSDQHAAMACDCLNAGTNVLVTKPWAVNASEADTMIAAAKASGKMLLPWLPARWGSDLRRLKELVADEVIGKVFLVRRVVTSFGTRCDWQTERRFGGGYLLNWGPHIVDPPVQLIGSPVASVFGRLKQTINPGDAEDLFFAAMTLQDGTLVQAEFTISPEKMPGWFIQGDKGAIIVQGRDIKVHRSVLAAPSDPTKFSSMQATEKEITEETLGKSEYGDEYEIYNEIAAAIRGEKPYPVRPEDALQLSRVLDAIRASSAQNKIIIL